MFCDTHSAVLWVDLQGVIVAFPDHSHLLFKDDCVLGQDNVATQNDCTPFLSF